MTRPTRSRSHEAFEDAAARARRATRRLGSAALVLGCALWLAGQTRAAQELAPNGPVVANVRIDFPGPHAPAPSTPKRPEHGYFKLKSGLGIGGDGGWVRVQVEDFITPSADARRNPSRPSFVVDDEWTFFPTGLSMTRPLRTHVPEAVRDRFWIKVEMIQRPAQDLRRADARDVHTLPFAVLSGNHTRPSARVPALSPAGFARDDHSWIVKPGTRPRWIETDLVLRYSVWPDPELVDTRLTPAGVPFVYEIPLRIENGAAFRITPFLGSLARTALPGGV